ncbi:AAA family ATPase [Alsobacter sp. R-9]
MLALVVTYPGEQAHAKPLVAELERLRSTVEIDDIDNLKARLQQSGLPDIVLILDTRNEAAVGRIVRSLAANPSPVGYFIYVADQLDAEVYRELVRTGRGDWVRANKLREDLSEVFARMVLPFDKPVAGNARIVTFMPVAGGVGTTTLAMETAIDLVRRKGDAKRRVCVLDLNIQTSSIADFYDIEPRFDVPSVLDDPSRLDEHLVELLTARHESGVDVICSKPTSVDLSRIDSALVFSLLDQLATRYDLVAIDLPVARATWTDDLLAGSDAVVVIGTFDVPSLKRLTAAMKHLDGLGVDKTRRAAVVNRFENRMFGSLIKRSDIDTALSGNTIFTVSSDAVSASEAINTGQSLVMAGKSRKLVQDLTALATWIDQPDAAKAQTKTSFWKR